MLPPGMLQSLLVLCAFWAGSAAAFEVYHAPAPGPNPGIPAEIPTGGSAVLELYFDNGATTSNGTPCRNGDGDEVCGFDVHVQTTGGVSIDPNGFTPAPGVVHTQTASLLRANGGNPATGDSGPTKIGDLAVSASDVGTVEVFGNQWVDAGVDLQAVPFGVVAVTGAGPMDLDGDQVLNGSDNCASIKNGPDEAGIPGVGNQIDGDADGVGDACDSCVGRWNPPITPLGFQTTTGGQLDDDADGWGNQCDADVNNADNLVNPSDLLLFTTALGKKRNKAVCGFAADPCDIYDLSGADNLINPADLVVFQSLYGKKLQPRCPQCGPPYPDPNLPCVGDACP